MKPKLEMLTSQVMMKVTMILKKTWSMMSVLRMVPQQWESILHNNSCSIIVKVDGSLHTMGYLNFLWRKWLNLYTWSKKFDTPCVIFGIQFFFFPKLQTFLWIKVVLYASLLAVFSHNHDMPMIGLFIFIITSINLWFEFCVLTIIFCLVELTLIRHRTWLNRYTNFVVLMSMTRSCLFVYGYFVG